MNSLELTYELRKNGYTQKKLADELGCSTGFINHVIRGRKSSEAVQQRIAEILDLPFYTVWPVVTDDGRFNDKLPHAVGGAQ